MRKSRALGGAAAAIALLFTAQSALADTLTLDCKLHWTRAGGASRNTLRRIELDMATHTVRFYDDLGAGMKFVRQYRFLSANGARIELENARGVQSYLDRRTGRYVLINRPKGFSIAGTCVKAPPRKNAF